MQPVLLAVSLDGGRHWVTRGQPLPGTGEPRGVEQVVATSVQHVWAVSDQGTLVDTVNGGRTWTAQPVPGPVLAVAGTGG